MNEMVTIRRRWFRCSLRTLFVVLTVLGVLTAWLLSEYRVVRERAMAIRQIERDGGSVFYATRQPLFGRTILVLGECNERIPSVRQLIGDKACFRVMLPPVYRRRSSHRAYLEHLFPEAKFYLPDNFPNFT